MIKCVVFHCDFGTLSEICKFCFKASKLEGLKSHFDSHLFCFFWLGPGSSKCAPSFECRDGRGVHPAARLASLYLDDFIFVFLRGEFHFSSTTNSGGHSTWVKAELQVLQCKRFLRFFPKFKKIKASILT